MKTWRNRVVMVGRRRGYGTVGAIAARLKQHLDAGADHVPVQVLTGPDKLVAGLAGPLAVQ